jgi:hypothetical protein
MATSGFRVSRLGFHFVFSTGAFAKSTTGARMLSEVSSLAQLLKLYGLLADIKFRQQYGLMIFRGGFIHGQHIIL